MATVKKIKPIYFILIVALIIRIIAALYLGNEVSGLSGAWDEISYSLLGERFANGHGLTFPTEWYPWIKPNAPQSYFSIAISIFIGMIYKIFGYQPILARFIFAILSTASIYVLYKFTKIIFGESTALMAAIISSFYAYLVFYGVTLLTEGPFILFLLLSLLLAYKIIEEDKLWMWIVLGVTLSICLLLRMAVLFFIPILLGWLVYQKKEKVKYLGIPIIIIVIVFIPFIVHNYLLWHRFLLLEAQFGHVFWNGNHPDHNGIFSNEVFEIPSAILAMENDAEITNQLLKLGIQNVLNDPINFIKLTISRLGIFFTFWPTEDTNLMGNIMRVMSFGIMFPFALIGMWLSRSNWRKLLPVYFFFIIHTFIYAISWTMIRYRIPIDILLIPFAAYTINYILNKFTHSL